LTELSRLEKFLHEMYKDGGDRKLEFGGFGVEGYERL